MLRDHGTREFEEPVIAGRLWQDNDLVFCLEEGSILSLEWLTRLAN
jgi:hypothetical protein